MNDDLFPETPETPASPKNLLHTALFGIAILLIPILLGVLFVLMMQKMKAEAPLPPLSTTLSTNQVAAIASADPLQLFDLRRDLRNDGYPTDEPDLRIWAAHSRQFVALFRVAPPSADKRWNWHLSQDGLFAIAVSIQTDEQDRREVGLYDLFAERWLWKKDLPWPDSYEAPYVFNRHVVLRYTKNARHFALEINPEGTITGIDTLGKNPVILTPPMHPVPGYPGDPVAIKAGVLFTVLPTDQSLIGCPMHRLPGLNEAGKGDATTRFSGNSLLKFTFGNGAVTVSDSLTQTVLQRIEAWPKGPGTVVTGAQVNEDGSRVRVFLRTTFAGPQPTLRDWSADVDTYAGTTKLNFNDAPPAEASRVQAQTQALSGDGRWQFSLAPSNTLVIADQKAQREVARVNLDCALAPTAPVDSLALLQDGQHLVLRQKDDLWLLDFAVAQKQAGLLSRLGIGRQLLAQTDASTTNAIPASALAAYRAGQAEWYAGHHAWGYAAYLLDEAAGRPAADVVPAHINPLLRARVLLLAGQKQKAKAVCRAALATLATDNSDYNRMIRYQLQGLLFAP